MVVADTQLTLVLGPSRSGKSRWAEHLASRSNLPVAYLATAANDGEDALWQARLDLHRQRRPSAWQTLEVGFALADHLDRLEANCLALVDSLGTWVAWGLEQDREQWDLTCTQLIQSVRRCSAPLILVSEQAGWGVVPSTAIGGLFRDRLGSLEQQLMPLAASSWLVVAGRALNLQSHSVAVPP
jgi:adenosylcobinamide kinase/adenosylcobinamide-phosphate guanylyltransferase